MLVNSPHLNQHSGSHKSPVTENGVFAEFLYRIGRRAPYLALKFLKLKQSENPEALGCFILAKV